MTVKKITLYILIALSFSSCFEKRSSNAAEVYKLWSSVEAPNGIKPINGEYWESSELAFEYKMYLELQVTSDWIENYIKLGKLKNSNNEIHKIPKDAPAWFSPNSEYKLYTPIKPDKGSMYFINRLHNKVLIYEVQL